MRHSLGLERAIDVITLWTGFIPEYASDMSVKLFEVAKLAASKCANSPSLITDAVKEAR